MGTPNDAPSGHEDDQSSDDRSAREDGRGPRVEHERVRRDAAPVLPEQTRDDDPAHWGEHADERADEERIMREVPPHYA